MFRYIEEGIKKLFRRHPKLNGSGLAPPAAGLARDFDLRPLQAIIGHRIRQPELFVEALLHRSYLQYQDIKYQKSNERLEFLGDSVLNLVVGEYLYNQYPDAEEGELTKLRSRLVSRKALAIYARQLNLEEYMLVSSSVAESLQKGNESILADAYEAIIAAIYLDSGYEAARRFVERQVLGAIGSGVLDTADQNFKSLLLEYAQAHGLGVPKYTTVKEEGPDHDRTFTVEVLIDEQRCGIGVGKNKKEAEQSAALQALKEVEDRDWNSSA